MGAPGPAGFVTIRSLTLPNTIRRVPPWTTLLGIALFGLALFWLHHVLAQYRWRDILAHVQAIPTDRLLEAVVLSLGGYGCLTLYDALGLRFAGAKVTYARLALISFMGYAIGHNVGMNTLSGGAIRYRAYLPLGLTAKQVGMVVGFGTLTFVLGTALLLGLSLLSHAGLSGSVMHVHPGLVVLVGCVLLAGVGAYLWLASSRHETLRYRRIVIPVPSVRIAFAQVAVGCSDLLCAAGVLYVLLPPQAAIGFAAFAGLYLIAIAAGVISNVPGGVGVFESVLLLLFRTVPADHLLGALLAYRIIYYFVPFGLALGLLGWHEIWVHRGPMVRLGRLVRSWASAVTPQASAIAVFGAGAVLLFSGATPGIVNRMDWLRSFVPLPILELSHLLGSAVGVGLLILANGLYRRLDAAWWLTIWLLCAGVLLSLLKGFDYEEATILGAVVVVLVSARTRFRRRASLIEQRFSGPWIVAVLLVLGFAVGLVLFAFRHVPYEKDLWWEFAFEAQAPRSLRALLLAAMVAAAYGLWAAPQAVEAAELLAGRGRLRAGRSVDRQRPRLERQPGPARRQASDVQRGSHRVHHVPAVGEQLGLHGGSGGAGGAVRAPGVGVPGALRRHGRVAGVLPGGARQSVVVHRPRPDLEQAGRGGTGAAAGVLAGRCGPRGSATDASARPARRRGIRGRGAP